MPRVLLIEDEEMLGSLVKEGLEAFHYEVARETNGRNGLERPRNNAPILMPTARDGADDYLT